MCFTAFSHICTYIYVCTFAYIGVCTLFFSFYFSIALFFCFGLKNESTLRNSTMFIQHRSVPLPSLNHPPPPLSSSHIYTYTHTKKKERKKEYFRLTLFLFLFFFVEDRKGDTYIKCCFCDEAEVPCKKKKKKQHLCFSLSSHPSLFVSRQ